MDHHICKGTCGAVSEQSGTCSAEGCTHQGKLFEQCDCGDMSNHAKEGGMDMSADADTSDEGSQ